MTLQGTEASVEELAAGEATADDDGEVATSAPGAPEMPADDLGLVRELILRTHSDIVPELIRGETIAEVLASVPEAQAAYARIAVTAARKVEPVPAGGVVRTPSANVDGLSAMGKIRRGLSSE